MKKIVYVTTARSEYNASRLVIKAINDDPDFELEIWCGGNHYEEIIKDGYENIYFMPHYNAKTCHNACLSIGNIIFPISRIFDYPTYIKPELLILNGDRIELIPYVLVASLYGVPVVHIGGGDITDGSLDNETRYAISRYAHLHFVSDEQAAENLIKSGEESWRVCVTGQCGLENIIRTEKLSLEETSKDIGLDLSIPTAVCIYYPSRELNISIQEQIDVILNALHETNTQTVFIYPCAEIGSDIIRQEIDKYCKTHNNCKVFVNLENQLFQSLLWHCNFMIGNSSAGVIEAPFVKKWAINVGNRQNGRYVHDTEFKCDYKKYQLINAINFCYDNPINFLKIEDIEQPSKKIIQAIKENIENPQLIHKRILL